MQLDTEHTFEMVLVSINILLHYLIFPIFLGIRSFILVFLQYLLGCLIPYILSNSPCCKGNEKLQ